MNTKKEFAQAAMAAGAERMVVYKGLAGEKRAALVTDKYEPVHFPDGAREFIAEGGMSDAKMSHIYALAQMGS